MTEQVFKETEVTPEGSFEVYVTAAEFPEWHKELSDDAAARAVIFAAERTKDDLRATIRSQIRTIYPALKADFAKLSDPATTFTLALLVPIVRRMLRAIILNTRANALVEDEEAP